MRRLLILMMGLTMSWSIQAQEFDYSSWSFSYYAPYAIQAGLKVGKTIPINTWTTTTGKEQETDNSLLIQPQIAYFANPQVQQNYLANIELGYARTREDRKFYNIASIGLGFIYAQQFVDGSVAIGSGEVSHNKENINYFVPTINYEWGKKPKNKLGYYFKGFWGHRITGQRDNSGFLGLETGLKLYMN